MSKERSYKELLCYYERLLNEFDIIHYNSSISRGEYERILGTNKGKVINITHKGIRDNRSRKAFNHHPMNVGFIGSESVYKGLPILIEAVSGLDIDLIVWGGRIKEKGRIHYKGRYNKANEKEVFEYMDLLVVPSLWKETFSLVALEAMSYGVPVLVSDNVGAKDIIIEYDPYFVYHSKKELRERLESFLRDKTALENFNQKIVSDEWRFDAKRHAEIIIETLYKG